MVEMTCEEHDKLAASSQFITHTVGRMLGRMELPDTPINTKGYESLLSLVRNTTNDSFDLYYGLFMYNEVRAGGRHALTHAFCALLTSFASFASECDGGAGAHGGRVRQGEAAAVRPAARRRASAHLLRACVSCARRGSKRRCALDAEARPRAWPPRRRRRRTRAPAATGAAVGKMQRWRPMQRAGDSGLSAQALDLLRPRVSQRRCQPFKRTCA